MDFKDTMKEYKYINLKILVEMTICWVYWVNKIILKLFGLSLI